MSHAKETAKQEWEVFKALCPKELMDIIESPDITPVQYCKLINTLKALSFYDSAMLFMIRRHDDVKSRWKGTHPEDIFVISSTQMRKEKYGYEYVQLFIDNVKNINLKNYFKKFSERYPMLSGTKE